MSELALSAGALTDRAGPIFPDDISAVIDRSWADLFHMGRADAEDFQMAGARRRFAEQRPLVKALQTHSDSVGVTAIDRLEDLAPLLFQESIYKSYPVSLIEKNRFDLLTKWLGAYTVLSVSTVDVSACQSIDSWLAALDAQTALRVIHTSGTTGKLSFIPRSVFEEEFWFKGYVKCAVFDSRPEFSLGREGDERLPMVAPMPRFGRYVAQRNLRYIETRVVPTPEQLYTISDGTLSADLVSLSGRIRVAQAKGTLSQLKLPDALRAAMRQYLQELERRPQESAAFFRNITDRLRGKRVIINAPTNLIFDAAVIGLKRGMRGVFSPDSIGVTGGGGKDVKLPPNWLDVLREFTGIADWRRNYGLSELVGIMPMCEEGYYHIQPYIVPFLLEPHSGELLPREGTVTGRFAFFDLLAQTYWGGMVSGDKLTITWDWECPCGRFGPRVHNDITRYSAEITGEDKVTCAATVDSTDAALKQLLAL
jgi:hypothetical protein